MELKNNFGKYLILPLFFILLLLYTKLFGPIPFSVNSVTTNKTDIFTVSGEGKSTIKPDMALISAGVQTQGATVKAVQDELNSKINKVSAALKDLGIKSEDIQTSNYSIYPDYDFRTDPRKISGYQASTNLQVKVRDMEKINAAIDSVTANGANQVGGVNFEVSDKIKAENEARQKAVDDAKRKAQLASQTAGFKLGRIINYSENYANDRSLRPVYSLQAEDASEAKTSVEPGSSEINVIVNLSYEIQ